MFTKKNTPQLLESFAIKTILVLSVILSSVCLVLQTEPSLSPYKRIFVVMENLATTIFALEYLYRLHFAWKNHDQWQGIKKYVFSFLGIIDLLSFLPQLIPLPLNPSVLLTLKLTRLFKITRYSSAFTLLKDVLQDEAESLLVSMVLMFILVMFASIGIYVCERNVQPQVFGSIPRAMWWAIVTLTTVGYGDVTPITPQGKIFATLITIAGVGLVSLPAGIIASGFTEQMRLRREQFALEVEELLEDGSLSKADLTKLEQDRKRLGLDETRANLIISQVKHKEIKPGKKHKRRL